MAVSLDLTTEWKAYIIALKAAATTARDVTTLVAKDLPTVRASDTTQLDDANTMYQKYLD